MRKILSFLMLFCVYTEIAWAIELPTITTDLNNPVYYTLYNTRSHQPGGLMYWAGDNIGIKDGGIATSTLENKYKFFFTGTHEAMFVHNAATGKKLATIGNGQNAKGSWSDEGTEWTVVVRSDGYLAFGPKGAQPSERTWWNECNYETNAESPDFTVWDADDAGSAFVAELASNYSFPEAGKYYAIEAPLFFNKQGVNKGLVVNQDGSLGWNTFDKTNKNCYWTIEISGNEVAFKNLGTGKYLNGTDMSDTKVNGNLRALSSNQFNIVVNSTTLHANEHNNGLNASGTIITYGGGAGSASAWQFVEKEDPDAKQLVTVNYTFTYKGNVVQKYSQSVDNFVGDEYPNITTKFPFGISATKPTGVISDADVTDGAVNKTIALEENLPFEYAADYESINKWYFLQIRDDGPTYWNYDSTKKYINATNTSLPEADADRDAYSWAFIGNPIDGFKIVNSAAGDAMILSAPSTPKGNQNEDQLARMVQADTIVTGNTVWNLVSTTHANAKENAFYIEHPVATNYAFNRQDKDGGKAVCYWSSRDTGSAVWVKERDFTRANELQELVDAVEAAAPNYVVGDAIGYYTQASVDAVVAAIAAAKTALAGEMTKDISDQHMAAINSAIAGLTVNMPTPGAYYRLKNVYRQKYIATNGAGTRVQSDENKADASLIWTIEKNGDTYKVKNINYGENGYMKAPNGGNNLVDAASAASYTLRPLGEGQFNLVISGSNLVIFNSGELGAWSSNPKDSDGAWLFIPATELEVAVAADYGTIHLPFDVTLGESTAYAVTATNAGYATLTEKADIPANQGAILPQGTHTLTIAEASSDWTGNLLEGSNVNTYVEGDAYVLANGTNGVALYKAALNKNAEGAEGTTHFLNNANKAYLPAPTASATNVLRFSFGEETAIENVEMNGLNSNAPIYDLSGRRVMNTLKGGIYIQNGKKFIVK